MAIVEQWSVDPGQNTKSPPLGAPEGGLPWDRVSDLARYIMAGGAELRERVIELEDNGVGSADNAERFANRTRQQFYDDFWPVGSERGWYSTSATGLTPSGLVATWVLVAKDGLLAGADPAGVYTTPGATIGAGTAAAVDSAGSHNHGGVTGSTVLTEANLGSNLDATPVLEGDGTARRLARVVPESGSTAAFSGATGHTHSISSAGAHTHDITLPKRYVTAWFRRTA
jgi:hypothetical protein